MSKTLNDISPDFRDFLLSRNLSFARTIENNSLSSRTNGIGRAINLDGNDTINESPDFDSLSQEYLNSNISNNSYNFEDGYGTDYGRSIASNNPNSVFTVSNLEAVRANLSYNPYTFDGEVANVNINELVERQTGSRTPYFNSSGEIVNSDAGKIRDINSIASLITGAGVGINTDDSMIPNYDVRSSIIGRALLANSGIQDTPLGQIQHLSVANIIKNKVVAGIQRKTLGRVNLNPISLLKGSSLFQPNYDITVGGNILKKGLNLIEGIGGFEVPISKMGEGSSIFHSGRSISIEELTNNQIKDTGNGQVNAMFDNLKENKYVPNYKNGKDYISDVATTYDDVYDDFKGLKDDQSTTYETLSPAPNSLLEFTQFILGEDKSKTLINKKGHTQVGNSEISSPVSINGTKIISKGSGVKSKEGLNGNVDPDKVFGRVFTVDSPYSRVKDLQKKSGLTKYSTNESVLGPNGFVRVAPEEDDDAKGNMKNFMFSIENLAWDGETSNLPNSEVGPGDPKNGTNGRIMWFPPYDITIDDSTSVNWNSSEFIGRGEPIYTYNNTERFGTLGFKMIIDYPSYIDELTDVSDDVLASIMSGVLDVDDIRNLSKDEINKIKEKQVQPQVIHDNPEVVPDSFELYFAKDVGIFDPNFEGNSDIDFAVFDDELINTLIEDCPSCTVTVKGFVSDDEEDDAGDVRGISVSAYLKAIGVENPIKVIKGKFINECGGNNENSPCRKKSRRVNVGFIYEPSVNENNIKNESPTVNSLLEDVVLTENVTRRFMNETKYFKAMKESDPIFYSKISDKVKHFHPSFHSMTPEGFNSRLNFLHQCTRQGPTKNNERASNMAFGKPPVCILRLGDFYHTKIIIDTLNLTFEPLVWDMNPEGIGVQPMICNVQLSFKIIGGSSLKGPVNKLMNAVSFNFFGNTETFDPRADKLIKQGDGYRYDSIKDLHKHITGEGKVVKDDVVKDETKAATVNTESSVGIKTNPEDIYSNLQITSIVQRSDEFTFKIIKKSDDVRFNLVDGVQITIIPVIDGENQAGIENLFITESQINADILLTYNLSEVTSFSLIAIVQDGGYKIHTDE